MLLRYLKGDSITLHVRRVPFARNKPYAFTPFAEVPEKIAKKILRDPRYRGQFGVEVIPPPVFTCEICGRESATRLGYIGHKRKHSDKIPHARTNKKEKAQ